MAREIEHKFTVVDDDWLSQVRVKKIVKIEQGYLSVNQYHQVRIRIANSKGYITVKGPSVKNTRDEFEYKIPIADARSMMLMCSPTLSKTRYVALDKIGQLWEIDVYHGVNEGLVVAEIELTQEDQPIIPPVWIGKDVTHDKRYSNSAIATRKLVLSKKEKAS